MLELRGDLHVHSTCSDGRASPREIVLRILELGFQIVVVTDHDTFEGSLRAASYIRSAGYELVPLVGAEIRTEEGDVLVYCPDKPLSRIPRHADELVDHAHEEGCIAVAAHPYDFRRYGVGDRIFEINFDAIEIFNAMSDPWANNKAAQAAKQLGKPGLANSDAHVPELIGASYNVIIAEPEPGEVIKAIREGRVKPVPGRAKATAYIKSVAWAIARKLGAGKRRKRREPTLPYEELTEFQDYAPL